MPPSVPKETLTPELIVDLSLARVSITSAFQGESILLFACSTRRRRWWWWWTARETVLRKQRLLGLWLRTGRQAFDDVPA